MNEIELAITGGITGDEYRQRLLAQGVAIHESAEETLSRNIVSRERNIRVKFVRGTELNILTEEGKRRKTNLAPFWTLAAGVLREGCGFCPAEVAPELLLNFEELPQKNRCPTVVLMPPLTLPSHDPEPEDPRLLALTRDGSKRTLYAPHGDAMMLWDLSVTWAVLVKNR